jgi:hypothetical protein
MAWVNAQCGSMPDGPLIYGITVLRGFRKGMARSKTVVRQDDHTACPEGKLLGQAVMMGGGFEHEGSAMIKNQTR